MSLIWIIHITSVVSSLHSMLIMLILVLVSIYLCSETLLRLIRNYKGLFNLLFLHVLCGSLDYTTSSKAVQHISNHSVHVALLNNKKVCCWKMSSSTCNFLLGHNSPFWNYFLELKFDLRNFGYISNGIWQQNRWRKNHLKTIYIYILVVGID